MLICNRASMTSYFQHTHTLFKPPALAVRPFPALLLRKRTLIEMEEAVLTDLDRLLIIYLHVVLLFSAAICSHGTHLISSFECLRTKP